MLFGIPVRAWKGHWVDTIKNAIQNYRRKGRVKQKSVTKPRLGCMQVETRQCWNCDIVYSIYVAVVSMTFGTLEGAVIIAYCRPPVAEGPAGRQ